MSYWGSDDDGWWWIFGFLIFFFLFFVIMVFIFYSVRRPDYEYLPPERFMYRPSRVLEVDEVDLYVK